MRSTVLLLLASLLAAPAAAQACDDARAVLAVLEGTLPATTYDQAVTWLQGQLDFGADAVERCQIADAFLAELTEVAAQGPPPEPPETAGKQTAPAKPLPSTPHQRLTFASTGTLDVNIAGGQPHETAVARVPRRPDWLHLTSEARLVATDAGAVVQVSYTVDQAAPVGEAATLLVEVETADGVRTRHPLRLQVSPTAAFELQGSYPNPFNPQTVISYTLPATATVDLRVYDLLGREVALLVDGVQEAGRQQVAWNAAHLASGVYIYRLRVQPEQGTPITRQGTMLLAK